ncbi:hypothetical protein Plhal710r2_c007g0032191 [Plasmopara halstedii]
MGRGCLQFVCVPSLISRRSCLDHSKLLATLHDHRVFCVCDHKLILDVRLPRCQEYTQPNYFS